MIDDERLADIIQYPNSTAELELATALKIAVKALEWYGETAVGAKARTALDQIKKLSA